MAEVEVNREDIRDGKMETEYYEERGRPTQSENGL